MAVDEQALADSILGLTGALQAVDGPPVQPVSAYLMRIVTAAEDLLAADSAGILLLDEAGTLCAVASSTELAGALERAQQRLGLGPGQDTLARRGSVLVTDLTSVPGYAPLLAELGPQPVRAVLSVPIWVDAEVVGNLNLIRTEVHDWTDTEVRAAEAYAEVVGRLLGMSVQSWSSGPAGRRRLRSGRLAAGTGE
ncbi:MAG: GAF domain-containing protein [Jatrophihabitantaceae bacterium]